MSAGHFLMVQRYIKKAGLLFAYRLYSAP